MILQARKLFWTSILIAKTVDEDYDSLFDFLS